MSLFSLSDIHSYDTEQQSISAAAKVSLKASFSAEKKQKAISKTIGTIDEGDCCFFFSDGAWSNIDLLEYLLLKTGAADVYFSTWSISAEALTRFAAWKEAGVIKNLWVVLDSGLNNRKPDIYQQATGTFQNLATCKCHAKVTVIQNEVFNLVLSGSANYTRNPRKEAGTIIWNREIAEENIKWILNEFDNG